MKSEFNRIKSISRKIIGKKSFRKIKQLKDYTERTEGLKYLVDSKFKLLLLEIESKLEEVDKKEALVLESKLTLLVSKIGIFKSTYSKRDYDIVERLVKEIEGELENV